MTRLFQATYVSKGIQKDNPRAKAARLVCYNGRIAPVAQLDRVLVSEAKGREFESRRAHQSEKQSQDSDY
jgi:hypothetical protein